MQNERTKTINFTNRWTVINGKQTSRIQRWKMFIEITWKLFSRIIFQRVPSWGNPVKHETFMESFRAVVKSVFSWCASTLW